MWSFVKSVAGLTLGVSVDSWMRIVIANEISQAEAKKETPSKKGHETDL